MLLLFESLKACLLVDDNDDLVSIVSELHWSQAKNVVFFELVIWWKKKIIKLNYPAEIKEISNTVALRIAIHLQALVAVVSFCIMHFAICNLQASTNKCCYWLCQVGAIQRWRNWIFEAKFQATASKKC